jgi:membrane protease YdiL (CAAX protease family)
MPADAWTDIARMTCSFTAIAAVAVPVGWVCRRRTRADRSPVSRPRWAPRSGLALILGLYFAVVIVPVLVAFLLGYARFAEWLYGAGEESRQVVEQLWVGVIAAPVQIALLHTIPRPRLGSIRAELARAISAGVGWWFVLTPLVLVTHAGVNWAAQSLGAEVTEHPLTRVVAERSALDRLLFALRAGVVAPLTEELAFRGLLIGWLMAGKLRPLELRVWVVLVLAAGFALLGGGSRWLETTTFAALLVAGWAVLRTRISKRRTVGSVYASAALFAAIHSSVWPTPIPLFALGLGLGWVAVRTNGILAPVLVHGLFNAVSVLFVLSGGAK